MVEQKTHATPSGAHLLQTVPELVFEADAGLMACNDNRALRNRRLHGFSPFRYYMTAWPFGQENRRLDATRGVSCCGRVAVSGTEQGYMPRLSRDWERRAQSRRAAELLLVQHWNPLPRGAVATGPVGSSLASNTRRIMPTLCRCRAPNCR